MKKNLIPSLFPLALGMVASAHAQVLLLDFGPTGQTSSATNSPYHTAAPAFAGTIWNTVGTGDVSTGLKYADNSAAGGVTLNLGSSATTTIALGVQPGTSSALGLQTSSGVYAGNSVGKDGIFSGTSTSNQRVGLQIGGLAAGTYDVYVTARNTNLADGASGYRQVISAGAASASGDFDYTGYGSASLIYAKATAGSSFTSAWTEGGNYVKLSVTLTSGQFLNLAVAGLFDETRGFLNSVEIVNTGAATIPEPSTYAAVAGLAVLGCVAWRRFRG